MGLKRGMKLYNCWTESKLRRLFSVELGAELTTFDRGKPHIGGRKPHTEGKKRIPARAVFCPERAVLRPARAVSIYILYYLPI